MCPPYLKDQRAWKESVEEWDEGKCTLYLKEIQRIVRLEIEATYLLTKITLIVFQFLLWISNYLL